jgi:peptidoglycan/xylan/chitin deacetylase (PgdA/CDA1 family)
MKLVLFKILRISGIPFIIKESIQKRNVTIITFHQPLVDTFEICTRYLKKYYNIIPLWQYIEYLQGIRSIPNKSIIITLDDGLKNNYKLLNIIKEYKIPITIFLCSEIVGTTRHFWWTHEIVGYSLKELKRMPEIERRNLYKQNDFDYVTDYGEKSRQVLNMEEIYEMFLSGYVDFQSHTMSHVLLDKCDDSLALEEVQYSKINLEKKLNKPVYALAYPNGFYSDREIINVQKSGYLCALTMDPGFNTKKTNQFKLRRLGISDKANIDEIIVRTSGLWGFIKKIKKIIMPSSID